MSEAGDVKVLFGYYTTLRVYNCYLDNDDSDRCDFGTKPDNPKGAMAEFVEHLISIHGISEHVADLSRDEPHD